MTYREARKLAAEQLKKAGIENEVAESGFLMEFACGVNRSFYLLHQMDEMPQEQMNAYEAITEKRCEHIPLQHLTGEQEFMGIPFHVNEHVLIPRQDTEVLVEETLEIMNDSPKSEALRVLDMCTGSGCIAISLKKFHPEISVTASDVSEKALEVARENAAWNHAEVHFVESDLFTALSERYDMIVSNPPYIPSDVIPTLMPEVKDHEPMGALDGKEDGLFFYGRIVRESLDYLVSGGWILFEIGHDQGEAVSSLLKENGFIDIEVIKDLAGLDRVVKGRRL